jgi:SAM-dependent methyltransferase
MPAPGAGVAHQLPAAYGRLIDQHHADGNDTHGLGYRRVDEDPNVAVLVDTMRATARWPATVRLRSWEREWLRLCQGERLLDVGCGLGDAALALAADLGTTGEVVGIDASAAMLAVARADAADVAARARFVVGDAGALDEPDASFDAVRCERTLQWVTEPSGAVREMARVLRPGGRLSLIDSDWSTLTIDVGNDDLAARVRQALRVERNRPSIVGGRLDALVRRAGLTPVAATVETHTWHEWDPDASPAPEGCFSMQSLAADLVEAGQLATHEQATFVETVHAAARDGRFSMRLTMSAVVASR